MEWRRGRCVCPVVVWCLMLIPVGMGHAPCSSLLSDITSQVYDTIFQDPTVRVVDGTRASNDSEECLNAAHADNPPPCATLHYALYGGPNASPATDLVVYLHMGKYQLSNGFAVVNSHQVAIIGINGEETELHCGTDGLNRAKDNPCLYENFQVLNSTNVLVANITFTGCGPITSNIFVTNSQYILFHNCVVRDNRSPPVLVQNTPHIAFVNTTFRGNHAATIEENVVNNPCYSPRGAIFFFTDNSSSSGGISLFMESQSTFLVISQSTFYDNIARHDSLGLLQRDSQGFGHGGGLTLRLVNSSRSLICIDNSTFDGNRAQVNGGAIAASMAQLSSNNQFVVSNSTFMNNTSSGTGGAIGFDLLDTTTFNLVSFENCNFSANIADTGGAVALATSSGAVTNVEGKSNSLRLTNCVFEKNTAQFEGSAVAVLSLSHVDQVGIPTDVSDCYFERNKALDGDQSAITVYRVLLTFRGNTTFLYNTGGGVTLLSSRMDLQGAVIFSNNTAIYGAGLALSGGSQMVLHPGSSAWFIHNVALEQGGGVYIDNLGILVSPTQIRGCFIQYDDDDGSTFRPVGIPVSQWDADVQFIGNTAVYAGAAIYANDMSRCVTVDSAIGEYIIFNTSVSVKSPFFFQQNLIVNSDVAARTVSQSLGSDAKTLSVRAKYEANSSGVSVGETVAFILSAVDDLNNSRESAWSVNAPQVPETLGALSTDQSIFSYEVPVLEPLNATNVSANISVVFALLSGSSTQSGEVAVSLWVSGCHPGFTLDETSQQCECMSGQSKEVVRCDSFNRYFYVQEGYWVGVREDRSVFFASVLPGFLNCTRLGSLSGCLYEYDRHDDQCAPGRKDTLCGRCEDGYGVTFDLRFCEGKCDGGLVLFIGICILTFIISAVVLYFDFPLPTELKGIVFFAQVIGVIYRNTPYLQSEISVTPGYQVFDFMINMLGLAVPFPVCLWETLPAVAVAFLGFCPPIIALLTAVIYTYCASRVNLLSNRTSYGFHGFYFIAVFIYKYLVDTLFIFITCTNVDGEYVFAYDGTVKCMEFPFVLAVTVSALLLLVLVIVLPLSILKLAYRPQKALHVSNALTWGLKEKRQYVWYGVWEIWRRLPFVAVNLLIAFTTRSVVLFCHALLILVCLSVVCVVKPYKRAYINVVEAWVIMCLLAATLAILDDNDQYIGYVTSITYSVLPFVLGAFFISFKLVALAWSRADRRWSLNTQVWIFLNRWKRSFYQTVFRQHEKPSSARGGTTIQTPEQSESDHRGSQASRRDGTGVDVTQGRDFFRLNVIELREPLLDYWQDSQ